jgi:hypothetical protein
MSKRKFKDGQFTKEDLSLAAAVLGHAGGRIGGRRRAQNLTPEQLTAIGKLAAKARWGERTTRKSKEAGA